MGLIEECNSDDDCLNQDVSPEIMEYRAEQIKRREKKTWSGAWRDSWALRRGSGFGFMNRSKRDSRAGNSNRDSLVSFSRRGNIALKRPIYTEALFDEGFVPDSRPSAPFKDSVKKFVDKQCACSKDRLIKFIYTLFPFLTILRGYGLKTDLLTDMLAGLTVGILNIPQGMAYALLADLSPVNGLYVSFFPVLVYFFFGSSRHMSIGTFAVICLMVGTVVSRESGTYREQLVATGNYHDAIDNDTLIVFNGSTEGNGTSKSLDDMVKEYKVSVALALGLVVGVFQLLMGIFRLGFVTIYLSQPLVSGFTTGAACHVFSSQIKYILGISTTKRFNGPLKLVYTYIELFKNITTVNWAELITSVICILVIYLIKDCINARFKDRMKMPVPIDLIVVAIGTFISYFAFFETNFDVRVVGYIPTGVPPPRAPEFSLIPNVIGDAVAIAIVSYAVSVSLAKILAKRNNYEVDSNQELVAHGMTNVVCSFFNCFVASGSLSRSLVQDNMGGKTQVAGLFSSALIFIVLIALAPLFESLPNCVLASIIVVALKGMFMQFKDLKNYWRISKYDFAIWLVTWLSVVVLDVDLGLGVGVGFSLLTVVFRTQRAYCGVLGRIPHTDIYKDTNIYSICKEVEDIKILSFEASLYYANVEHFRQRIYALSKANPMKLTAERTKILARAKTEQARIDKEKKKAEKRAEKDIKKRQMTEMNGNKIVKVEVDPENRNQTSVSIHVEEEKQPLHETEVKIADLPKYAIHHIILDCSMMSYIDSVGVSTLMQLITEYKTIDIDVFLANCQAGVRDMLYRTGFYDTHDRAILFPSVHDAVLSALKKRTDILAELKQDTEIATSESMASLPTRASRSSTFLEHYINPRHSILAHDTYESDEDARIRVIKPRSDSSSKV